MKYKITIQKVPAKSLNIQASDTETKLYCFVQQISDAEAAFTSYVEGELIICNYRPTTVDITQTYKIKADVIQDLTGEVMACYYVRTNENGERIIGPLTKGGDAVRIAWLWNTVNGDLYTFTDIESAEMSHESATETIRQVKWEKDLKEVKAKDSVKSKCTTYRLMEALAKVANDAGEGVQVTKIEFEDGSGRNFNVTLDGVNNKFVSLAEGAKAGIIQDVK